MSDERITPASLRGVVLFAAFIYLVILFIGAIAKVVIVFAIIALATVVLNPLVTWLEARKIPRSLSAFVLALLLLGFLALLGWLISPRVIKDFGSLISRIPTLLTGVHNWLEHHYPSLADKIPASPGDVIRSGVDRLLPLLGGITGYALTLADILVSAFVIFISTIYTLSSPRPIAQGFVSLLKPEHREKAVEAFQEIVVQMRAWAFATIIAMFSIFALTWIGLTLLGVRAAFLIAIISGVLEIVPVLGPVASGAIAVLAALGQNTWLALWTLLVFIGIQQFEGHILIPIVMSGRLQLHPVSVIFAVLVMGGLFGIVGIFLATPAAAVTKVLVYKFYVEPTTAPAGAAQEEIPEKAEQIITGTEPEKPEEKDEEGPQISPGVESGEDENKHDSDG